MKMSDPPITIEAETYPSITNFSSEFRFYKFYADKFFIIDGFEKEGNPCFIVIGQPKMGKGSFAGLKPGVIVLPSVPKGYSD